MFYLVFGFRNKNNRTFLVLIQNYLLTKTEKGEEI